MVQVLITGANGQVGWEAMRRAAKLGLHAVALSRADLDITKTAAVGSTMERLRPKVVLNAAAYTAVDKAEVEEDIAFAVNRGGPDNLAKACAEIGAALIHISTDYVFDGSKTAAYTEDDPVAPLGVYGRSKEAGEAAVRAVLSDHVILRTAWVFGVEGHNFVKTMLRLGAERDALGVVDDQIGCPTFAGDLAGAALTIASRIVSGDVPDNGFGTFHCAGGGQTSWFGFAAAIFAKAQDRGLKTPALAAIPTSAYPTPAQRPANSVLNGNKLASVYGVKLRPWEDGLADMLAETLAG
ncbi:MAG: dTDP-4-dehydrorhamnose reductase [Roseibium sp.]|nr:dTDP-4-dehydrorhamnose reductase [Roseibium sp.]